jgi:hypothetical protein
LKHGGFSAAPGRQLTWAKLTAKEDRPEPHKPVNLYPRRTAKREFNPEHMTPDFETWMAKKAVRREELKRQKKREEKQ